MGFRAWGPKQSPVYALSVGSTQATATTPTSFNNGGDQAKIYNSGSTIVLVSFYSNASGTPTLTFPVTGSPPTGQNAGKRPDAVTTLVAPGAEKQISIPATADSFTAIGSATGPSVIYVQRGDGST
jgi:D-tyrosyl-tRNA(Tyr) deacylase